ncbi:glycoside hydrolase family 3 C-terminal domain-containing protein [Kutzneria buriramensis]|uniref:Exo-alpha-(1->6)-L-arabinopyranosidase n=1 Tax=Kutzneria buriramensis TaxID=1045776 RepID=A0A3E0I6R1_9PSEU|nr:glycoside hydrolase family 3 C-terminal domain-containing protein [Kutzneria buriramensis]REH54413.1 beta-glucosidase [Kutzneria buriramensis]
MRVLRRALAIGVVLVIGTAIPVPSSADPGGSNPACPWVGSHAPVDVRTSQVLRQMTLDEKITMVHGAAGSAYTGFIPGDARLCVPALKLQDGPVGVRMADTTQLPAAADLAATFDPALARGYGQVIGAEDKAKGVDVDLGPTVNIVRDPRWGRAFESYSEDPYLTGQIGAADIEGIQSQGVMAQVKHYAVYNQETNRNTVSDNAVVDDRTVHEIYTAAFGAIVDQARPSSAMCSYSSINGVYACENAYLNNILKNQFGFDGFITSDWGGTHSTAASANAGMDMEMPDGTFFGDALRTAVQSGKVPQSRVDDMVTRIMREEFRFGLFDHPSPDTPTAVASTPAHVNTARKVAEDGAVLLKNQDNVLPLDADKVHSIAVIGDGAGKDALTAGGGSAVVAGTGTVTPFDGIKARAGSADVQYAQGNLSPNGQLPTIDSSFFTPPSGTGHGLQGEYFNNKTLDGAPVVTQTDPTVSYDWTGKSPVPGLSTTNYSVKWTGTLLPPATGTYTFGLSSDDGSRLFINGKEVIDNWRDQASHTETAAVDLTAGTPAQIEVDYYQSGGDATVNLGWAQPNQDLLAQAVALAAKSDVAIVYANDFESEGSDLANIELPGTQNQLIDAVAAVNPNTVVVLNTGSAVTMPWLDKVKGVFEAWYPGQEAGNAIAALLYGEANPSGKLPVTFPTGLDQVPASTAAQWPGVNAQVQYSERLDVGYRWYDAKNLTPVYPFGYGLSYTTFQFSHLRVDGSTLREDGKIRVSADVTNAGRRAGAEVAQLYLSDPAATGEPANQLKGFQKVDLAPRQTKRVTFEISAQAASYWNSDAQAWTLGVGKYTVHIGDSSRNLPLSGGFRVDRTSGPRFTKVAAPASALGGTTLSVTTTFTNGATEDVRDAALSLTVPAGWKATATSPSQFRTVHSGQSVSTTWSVSVPVGATPGSASLKGGTRHQGSGRTSPGDGSAVVQVAYQNLAAAYTDVGVSDDADAALGNLDGSGYSYSAQALATVGVTPGASVGGFTWPNVPAGQANTVTTAGQLVQVGGPGGTLSFLGTGTNGTQSGTVTVTYADGTTSTGTITLADWYSDAAVPGCTLVVTAPYWNRPAGSTLPANHPVSLYATSVPLTAGKQVASISLPSNARLHLFAAAIS